MFKRFTNLNPQIGSKSLLQFLKWKRSSIKPKWPIQVPIALDVPPASVDEEDRVRISFVGHVTFLIQVGSLNILTDPVWSMQIGPFGHFGPTRVAKPGIEFHQLPRIDIVLLSHNHYDHMDLPTLRKLWQRDRPHIITPLGNDKILKSAIKKVAVSTLNWGEHLLIRPGTTVYLEAAQHWSARGIFDRNRCLWGTFILKTPQFSVCFIGDTGYDPSLFKILGKKYPQVLVSLLPIGAYEPRWFMQEMHMNPEDAVMAHQDLQTRYSIASHFDCFQLADESFGAAAQYLAQIRERCCISENTFITPRVGHAYWFSAQGQ